MSGKAGSAGLVRRRRLTGGWGDLPRSPSEPGGVPRIGRPSAVHFGGWGTFPGGRDQRDSAVLLIAHDALCPLPICVQDRIRMRPLPRLKTFDNTAVRRLTQHANDRGDHERPQGGHRHWRNPWHWVGDHAVASGPRGPRGRRLLRQPRSTREAQEKSEANGWSVSVHQGNVGLPEDCRPRRCRGSRGAGRIDYLINNAG